MVNSHMLGVAVCAFRDFRLLPAQRKITEKKLRTPRLALKNSSEKEGYPFLAEIYQPHFDKSPQNLMFFRIYLRRF